MFRLRAGARASARAKAKVRVGARVRRSPSDQVAELVVGVGQPEGKAHTCEWQTWLGSASPGFEPCVAYG